MATHFPSQEFSTEPIVVFRITEVIDVLKEKNKAEKDYKYLEGCPLMTIFRKHHAGSVTLQQSACGVCRGLPFVGLL